MVTLNPYDMDETELVARTLMGEAGQQSPEGILAAGSVMANRVNSPGFGDSFRDVIMAPGQFSLYNDITGYAGGEGANDVWRGPIPPEIMNIASNLTSGNYQDPTGGAVNYFNPQISNPGWAEGRQFTDIGDHRFLTPEGQEVMGNPAHEGFVLPKSSSPMQNFAEERAQQSFEIQKNVTARMDELARTQDDAFRLTTGLATPQEIMQEQQAATAEKNETMRQTALEALQEQLAIPKGRGSVFTGDEFDTAGLYMYPNEAARNQASLPPHMRSSLGGAAGGPIPPDPATASIGPAGGPIPPGPATASIGPAGGPVPPDPLLASIGAAGGPIPPDPLSASVGAAGGPIPPGPAAAATASIGPAGGPIPPGPLSASIGAAGGPIPSTSRGVTAPAVTSGFNDPTVDYPVAAQTGIPSPAASGNAAPQSAAEEKDPWNWKLSLFEGLEGVGVGLGQMSTGQAVNMSPTFARQEAAKLGRDRLALDAKTEDRLGAEGTSTDFTDMSRRQSVADAYAAKFKGTPTYSDEMYNAIKNDPESAEQAARLIFDKVAAREIPAQFQDENVRRSIADASGFAAGTNEYNNILSDPTIASYQQGVNQSRREGREFDADVTPETISSGRSRIDSLAPSMEPEELSLANGLLEEASRLAGQGKHEEAQIKLDSMEGILLEAAKAASAQTRDNDFAQLQLDLDNQKAGAEQKLIAHLSKPENEDQLETWLKGKARLSGYQDPEKKMAFDAYSGGLQDRVVEATTNRRKYAALKQVESLIDNDPNLQADDATGAFQKAIQPFKELLSSAGIATYDGQSARSVLDALGTTIVKNSRVVGDILTERDNVLYERMSPTLGKSRVANKMLLQMATETLERQQQSVDLELDYWADDSIENKSIADMKTRIKSEMGEPMGLQTMTRDDLANADFNIDHAKGKIIVVDLQNDPSIPQEDRVYVYKEVGKPGFYTMGGKFLPEPVLEE